MRITEVESEAPKYREALSERLGRYLVAAKKLSPGEVILRERPIAVGPAVFNDNSLCSGCLRIVPNVSIMNLRFPCRSCKVAVFCSASCEERRAHHTAGECDAFRASEGLKDLSPNEFRAILLPLRLWLLQRNAELWGTVVRLEDHLEDRRNTRVWRERQETVVNILKSVELVPQDEDELLQRICGILDVNSFELRSPGSLDNSPLRGLYSQAALMAHDCRGNTLLTVDDDFTLTVFASVPVEEGDGILVNYAPSLLGSLERREFLQMGKYFYCNCQLCLDPEELGAHLSSIICPRCRKGFVHLEDCSTKTPFVREKVWQCRECGRPYSGRLVKSTLDLAQLEISEAQEDDAKKLEKLIRGFTRTFHPNHTLILNLKQKLLGVYRNDVATANPPKKLLQRILELCRDVLQVLEIVEPGISRLKGITLYEMHLPTVFLANRAYAAREISSEDLANRLEEALSLLKRALSMLLLEPATTPEGLLAKRALQEYKILREKLNDVKSLPSESKPCKKTNKKSN